VKVANGNPLKCQGRFEQVYVDRTSRYPFFSYSLFLAIDRVRLGARHTMVGAIRNHGLQLERIDNAGPVEKSNSQVTGTKCTTHSICFLDFQKVMARTFYVFYLPTNHSK